MLNKPAKYGIKIWVTRDAATSYAWKVQIYTVGKEGEKNHTPHPVVPGQLTRIVLQLTEGLQGHTVTWDNFT